MGLMSKSQAELVKVISSDYDSKLQENIKVKINKEVLNEEILAKPEFKRELLEKKHEDKYKIAMICSR